MTFMESGQLIISLRRLIAFLAVLMVINSLGLTSLAQTPVSPPVLPPGPALADAPNYSQWLVTFTYAEEQPSSTSPGGAQIQDSRPRTIKTTKTGEIIHEETTYRSGAKLDLWYVGKILYLKGSDSKIWGEINGNAIDPLRNTPQINQIPASGFRDLGWITRDLYSGIIKFGARNCLLFAQGAAGKLKLNDPLTQGAELDKLFVYALTDAETRLPVKVKDEGKIRSYQFYDPPTAMQTLPPDLADQIKKGAEAVRRLNQPMPRPY